MENWVPDLSERAGPLYLAIVEELAAAVEAGELRGGARLAPQRDLARALAVDVTTVSRAMGEAKRRGLVVARGRAGTFVAGQTGQRAVVESISDLSVNYPPAQSGAVQQGFRSTVAEVVARSDTGILMDYPRWGRAARHGMAGARWLGSLGFEVEEDRLTLAGGAQQALIGVMSVLCEPGDVVVTAGLTYPGLLAVGRRLGLRVAGVRMDAEGVVPEALEQTCRRLQPRLVYVVPTFQNPTAVTAGAKRRARLAEIVDGAGAWLVEDDGHAPLLEQSPMPISSLIPDRSYYVSSLSKSVSPGLRTAFVVSPSSEAAGRLSAALISLGQFPAPIIAEVATEWVLSGGAAEAVVAMREIARQRWELARRIVPALRAGTAFTNHFGWLPLPRGWLGESFAERARALGVQVTPAAVFAVARRFVVPGVRVCLGAVPTMDRLARALEVLAGVLDEDPVLSRPPY